MYVHTYEYKYILHTYEYKYILHTYVQCNKVRIGTYIYVHMYVSTYISARSTAIM